MSQNGEPEGYPDEVLLMGARGGKWLDEQRFDPLHYAIDGLIPEGFTLLVGPPKVGKSGLVLGFQLAVASGGVALSAIKVEEPRPVLYLALEDGHRRMQERCRKLLGPREPIPELFAYYTRVLPGQVVNIIEAWLRARPDTAMVVVDTLAKATTNMRAALARESNAYLRDYKIGDTLKAVSDRHPGLSMLVVHHARKSSAEENADFIERVSGTTGLTGSADTVAVVERKRGSGAGLLQITGRDVPEGEYAMTLRHGIDWRLDGRTLAEAAMKAAARDDDIRLGDVSAALVAAVREHPEGVKAGDLRPQFPEMADGKTLYARLGWLASKGYIRREGRGTYYPADDPTTQDTQQGGARAHVGGVKEVLGTGITGTEPNTSPTPNRGGYVREGGDWPPGSLGDAENWAEVPPPPDEPEDV